MEIRAASNASHSHPSLGRLVRDVEEEGRGRDLEGRRRRRRRERLLPTPHELTDKAPRKDGLAGAHGAVKEDGVARAGRPPEPGPEVLGLGVVVEGEEGRRGAVELAGKFRG